MHCKFNNFPLFIAIYSSLVILLTACPQPPTPPTPGPIDAKAEGVYVLNEGLFQQNNCTLTYYDFNNNTLIEDIFLQVNNRGLGDTGNDLKRYGSKLYCVVNNSHRVEVMDINTARSIKAISLLGKSPRSIVFYQDKAYVSCLDGDVVRIDTATLEVDLTAHSGANPEGLCISNGKLYVTNSGGYNPTFDSTMTVFDLSTMTPIKTIKVGLNPYKVYSDDNQTIYVCCRGNYNSVKATMSSIDATTDQITHTWTDVQNFLIYQDKAYVYTIDYNYVNPNPVKVIDLTNPDAPAVNFITDGTNITMPYGLAVNPLNGDIYISDAHDFTVTGDVYCFDQNGKKKFSFSAGLNPSNILIKY